MNADADHVRLGHHGFVTTDCESGAVTRLQLETEPGTVKRGGQDLAIGEQLDIRYAPVTIGSNEFLLPQQAIETAPFGKTVTKAEIVFRQYRQYESSSSITFDDDTGGGQ